MLSVVKVEVWNSLREIWLAAAILKSLIGISKGMMNSVMKGSDWRGERRKRKDMSWVIIKFALSIKIIVMKGSGKDYRVRKEIRHRSRSIACCLLI